MCVCVCVCVRACVCVNSVGYYQIKASLTVVCYSWLWEPVLLQVLIRPQMFRIECREINMFAVQLFQVSNESHVVPETGRVHTVTDSDQDYFNTDDFPRHRQ